MNQGEEETLDNCPLKSKLNRNKEGSESKSEKDSEYDLDGCFDFLDFLSSDEEVFFNTSI